MNLLGGSADLVGDAGHGIFVVPAVGAGVAPQDARFQLLLLGLVQFVNF